jgi:hypothetical protein
MALLLGSEVALAGSLEVLEMIETIVHVEEFGVESVLGGG